MRHIILIIISFLVAAPAYATTCYSRVQAEAEQGIRIHSELMVIGLNCQHMGKRAGKNLYGEYRQFTNNNAGLFSKYEQILMNFFQKNISNTPENQLNALRTKYANKISKDVASMRPDIFCARYAPRIIRASTMSQLDIRKWANTFYESHPVSYPLCEG